MFSQIKYLLTGRMSGCCLGKKGVVPNVHTAQLRRMNVMDNSNFISAALESTKVVCREDMLVGGA